MIVGYKCLTLKRDVSFAECMKCAKLYKECPYPPEILKGMGDEMENRGLTISVTMLTGMKEWCARKAYLNATTEVFVEPENLYYMFRGKLAHSIFEKYRIFEDEIIEQRFEKQIEGITVTGKPDKIIPELKMIIDWKTAKAVPKYKKPYTSHTQQMQMYRWLVPFEIEKLRIVYLDMSQWKILDIEKLWTQKELEDYILPKVQLLKGAFESDAVPNVCKGFPADAGCISYCGVSERCNELWREECVA